MHGTAQLSPDDFTLEPTPVAVGGFGKIYRGEEKSTGNAVAIKEIKPNPRVVDELYALEELKHPHIVTYYGHYIKDGNYYLVMELCEHGSLRDYMKKRGGVPMCELAVFHVLRQLWSVVKFLHKSHIIHRDISAGNILIRKIEPFDGFEKLYVTLCDFGLSKHLDKGRQAKTVVGTPGYMAPDVLTEGYNSQVDVYSMGCVLFYMLTNSAPPPRGRISDNMLMKIRSPSARDLIERMTDDETNRIRLKDLCTTDFWTEYGAGCSIAGGLSIDSYARSAVRNRAEIRKRSKDVILRRDESRESDREIGGRFRRSASKEIPITNRRISRESGYGSTTARDDRFSRPITRAGSYMRSGFSQPAPIARISSVPFPRCASQISAPADVRRVVATSQNQPDWPLNLERLGGQRKMSARARYILTESHLIREAFVGDYVTEILVVTPSKRDLRRQQVCFYDPESSDTHVPALNDPIIRVAKHTKRERLSLNELSDEERRDYYAAHMAVFSIRSEVVKFTCIHPSDFREALAEVMENNDRRLTFPNGLCYVQTAKSTRIGQRLITERSLRPLDDEIAMQQFQRVFQKIDEVLATQAIDLPGVLTNACKNSSCSWCKRSEDRSIPHPSERPMSKQPLANNTRALNVQPHSPDDKEKNKENDFQLKRIPLNTGDILQIVYHNKRLRSSTAAGAKDCYVYTDEDGKDIRFKYNETTKLPSEVHEMLRRLRIAERDAYK